MVGFTASINSLWGIPLMEHTIVVDWLRINEGSTCYTKFWPPLQTLLTWTATCLVWRHPHWSHWQLSLECVWPHFTLTLSKLQMKFLESGTNEFLAGLGMFEEERFCKNLASAPHMPTVSGTILSSEVTGSRGFVVFLHQDVSQDKNRHEANSSSILLLQHTPCHILQHYRILQKKKKHLFQTPFLWHLHPHPTTALDVPVDSFLECSRHAT